MTAKRASSTNGRIFTDARANKLLSLIATFLRSEGLSATEAERTFAHAVRVARRLPAPRALERIGHGTAYADIVGRWRRDKRFLDRSGSPRDLSLAGFAALIRAAGARVSAETAVQVLCRYGNIKKLGGGKYRLVSPLFFIASRDAMAMEPMASFLCDLASTLDRIIRRPRDSRAPWLFWRKAEIAALPERLVSDFVSYTDQRSLTFLEEIDDWLEAHAGKPSPGQPSRRVGVGLFSIYSEPELPLKARRVSRHR